MESDRRALLGALTLVSLGLVMAAVASYDVAEDVLVQGDLVVLTLLENAVPFALALLVVGAGVRVYTDDGPLEDRLTVVRWALVGTGGVALMVLWTLGFQLWQGTVKPAFIVSYTAIWGCVAGLLVGVYAVRQRRRERTIERVTDVTAELWNVDTALVGASSRPAMERAVCNRLTEVDRFDYAWIGDTTAESDTVEPRVESGLDGSPDGPAVTDGGSTIQQAARRDGEPRVDLSPRDSLTARIAVPVRYDGAPYGVLTVGIDSEAAFGKFEREALDNLGRRLGDAIHALRSREALLSDTLVEFTVEVTGAEQFCTSATAATDATLELSAADATADAPLAFFTVVEGDPDAVASAAEAHDSVAEVVTLTGREGGPGLQVVYDDAPFFTTVTEGAGRLADVRVDDGTATVEVWYPRSADTADATQLLDTPPERTELVGRQTVEVDPDHVESVEDRVLDSLTERQATVARTAYYGGYFETPRERTGEELAASLDITSPTFHDHLRAAESKLFEAVFEPEQRD
ncbi:helix-turn-helix domain-containing protein [Halomicroarcula sp. F13]|uniref:Helix-turn-helix domain-containing protein n=1 Tax=Haloarcula rubra TaxID=2487747 RepID=A0AAW4PRW1_9EURY|nr:bacterio-opsin activator domain-containing protein [Halomicroarcula rubra]MBX0323931.1 helix-turn-helix domain-containing protein [Halomicroarcula rubra]